MSWNKHQNGGMRNFDQMVINNEFSYVKVDKCVYKKCEKNGCVVISLYVDDKLIIDFSFQIVHKT